MKVKVPIYGTAPAKATYVEQGATVGAQIGTNLLMPDGKVGTLAQLQALFGSGTTGDASTGGALNTTDDLDEGQWHLWFTKRRAQDAVGGILTDTSTIDLAYTGGASITATLKDLADSGTGAALVKITRDAKGRISGTSAATTTDLTEGANLYFTNARSDARITLQKGVALGLAPLGSDGKINVSFLPAAVLGQVSYQGTWDASAGTPPTTTPDKGWYYIVTVAGTTDLDGITDWDVGDWAIYNGTAWDKIDNTDAVVTVNGYTGAVTLTAADVGAATAAQGALADSAVQSVVAGTNVTIDATDPQNPIISATGGGGSGDVVGPASAVDGDLALFDGITGKLIKSGGALNKAAVGLDNVDNTSDVNKPVSTEQQTALDLKGPLTSGVLAYRTTAQSIPSATSTKIAFEATSYDDGGYFSTSTPTRLTVPAAGKYRVSFVVGFAAAAAGNRLAFAQRNNADFPGRPAQRITPSGGLDYLSSTSAVVACAAGDYFELVANQTSSGAINVSSDSATLWFSIERLS